MEEHNDNESAKSPDFYRGNNAIKKRKPYLKPYTTTPIKTRNYLSNIPYTAINKEDFL